MEPDYGPGDVPRRGPPWLGQFVGVNVSPSFSEAQQRAQIAAHLGFARGTPAAIVAAAQITLTGEKTVFLLERLGGDACRARRHDPHGETPNPSSTQKMVLAAVPAGIVVTFSTVTGQPYAAAGAGKTYSQWKATYPTYTDLLKGA